MPDDEKSIEQLVDELNDARKKLSEFAALKAVLEESQQQYRALFNSFPLGITISNRSGNIVESNAIAEKLLGLSREEQGFRRIDGAEWSIIRPDGTKMPSSEYASVRALKENRLIENVEMGIVKPTGEISWINVSATPVHLGHFGLIITYGDITERVLAEQARNEIDAKLMAALESMSDAVFISDANGHFVNFNEAFATFHKFKSKEECFKTLIEYPDILDVFIENGDLVPLDMWAVPRALRGETVMNAEYVLRRKDTGETWVGNYNFAPIRNVTGSIVGAVVVGHDITARKEAERRLQESEVKFRKLFNSLPVATVIISLSEGNFFEINDAFEKIMGYSRAETLQKSELDLGIWVSPEDHLSYTSALKTERAVENFEALLRSRDGRILTALISGELIEVSGQMWAISSWLDISERRRLADDLTASLARLEDINAALRVLLEHREQDRPNMERRVLDNMRLLVLPYIEAIRGENPSPQILRNLNFALSKFEEITAGFAHNLEDRYTALTVSEIRVADMIRSGMTSKEIAHALGLSVTTANFYRASIRRKLGLVGKKKTLTAFLRAL